MFELRDIDFIQESETSISFVPSDKNINVNGKIHGGVLFTMCDELVGRYATATGHVGAAADANIHYYRPAEVGDRLTATLSERKVGRTLGIYLIELTNSKGKLIADSLFTIAFSK